MNTGTKGKPQQTEDEKINFTKRWCHMIWVLGYAIRIDSTNAKVKKAIEVKEKRKTDFFIHSNAQHILGYLGYLLFTLEKWKKKEKKKKLEMI